MTSLRSPSPNRHHRLLRLFAVVGVLMATLAASAEAPAPANNKTYAFDKDRQYVRRIQDLRPLTLDGGDEREPFEDVLLHAHQFTPAELVSAARKDLTLNELLDEKKEVRDGLRFELIHVEGKLKRLKRIPSLARLEEAGITDLYEAWIFPRGQRGNDPVCVIVSQPPPGVTPDDDITPGVPVIASGYYFKVLEYQSNQPNPKDPNRTLFRRAPLVLGRAVEMSQDPEPANASVLDLATLSLVFGGAVLLALFGLAVWLRRTDTGARRASTNRLRNPYTPPPEVTPGGDTAAPPADPTT